MSEGPPKNPINEENTMENQGNVPKNSAADDADRALRDRTVRDTLRVNKLPFRAGAIEEKIAEVEKLKNAAPNENVRAMYENNLEVLGSTLMYVRETGDEPEAPEEKELAAPGEIVPGAAAPGDDDAKDAPKKKQRKPRKKAEEKKTEPSETTETTEAPETPEGTSETKQEAVREPTPEEIFDAALNGFAQEENLNEKQLADLRGFASAVGFDEKKMGRRARLLGRMDNNADSWIAEAMPKILKIMNERTEKTNPATPDQKESTAPGHAEETAASMNTTEPEKAEESPAKKIEDLRKKIAEKQTHIADGTISPEELGGAVEELERMTGDLAQAEQTTRTTRHEEQSSNPSEPAHEETAQPVSAAGEGTPQEINTAPETNTPTGGAETPQNQTAEPKTGAEQAPNTNNKEQEIKIEIVRMELVKQAMRGDRTGIEKRKKHLEKLKLRSGTEETELEEITRFERMESMIQNLALIEGKADDAEFRKEFDLDILRAQTEVTKEYNLRNKGETHAEELIRALIEKLPKEKYPKIHEAREKSGQEFGDFLRKLSDVESTKDDKEREKKLAELSGNEKMAAAFGDKKGLEGFLKNVVGLENMKYKLDSGKKLTNKELKKAKKDGEKAQQEAGKALNSAWAIGGLMLVILILGLVFTTVILMEGLDVALKKTK